MEKGYKQIERGIIPKTLTSKVLLIVKAIVWKTCRFWGFEQVTEESKALCINHFTTKHFLIHIKRITY